MEGQEEYDGLSPEFFFNTCNVCYRVHTNKGPDELHLSNYEDIKEFATPKPLLSCGKCHVVKYCGVAHQRADWKRHKPWCGHWKVLKEMSSKMHNKATTSTTTRDVGERKYNRVGFERDFMKRALLKRELTQHESTIVKFQPECNYCGNTYMKPEANEKLIPCDDCFIVGFCPDHVEEGQNRHTPDCKTYLRALKIQQTTKRFLDLNFPCIWLPWGNFVANHIPIKPCNSSSFGPLSVSSWELYFETRKCPVVSPPMFDHFSFTLSTPVTILYILRRLYNDEELKKQTHLCIHIIGAASYEMAFLDKYEEILHLIPSLVKLELHFIGPEVPGTEQFGYDHDYCDECLNRNKKLSMEKKRELKAVFVKDVYHQYVDSKYYKKPDFCIAFNAGIHASKKGGQFDYWGPTLSLLLTEKKEMEKKIPFAVTCYNEEEAIMGAATLESYGCEFLIEPEVNPFRSLCVHREPTPLAKSAFFAPSQYLIVVEPPLEGSEPKTVWLEKENEVPHIALIRATKI